MVEPLQFLVAHFRDPRHEVEQECGPNNPKRTETHSFKVSEDPVAMFSKFTGPIEEIVDGDDQEDESCTKAPNCCKAPARP